MDLVQHNCQCVFADLVWQIKIKDGLPTRPLACSSHDRYIHMPYSTGGCNQELY